jgi:curved DNA-binding protein CbpA
MVSKKPAILLSYTGISNLFNPPQSSTSCRRRPPVSRRPPPTRQSRNYANLIDDAAPHSIDEEPDPTWPDPIHPHTTPTPYQILSLRKDEPYTKQRFYALVKLYHPDRCHPISPITALPRSTRLERYRLLVAAHTLLSDPAKRRAYDQHGHGWACSSNTHLPPSSSSSHRTSWPPGHDPMANATWEDWERWYARDADPPRASSTTPAFASNAAFVSLILALAARGGVGRATQASAFAGTALEQADKVHEEASRELMRARRATGAAPDRVERVQTFLEHRGAVLAAEDAYQRVLPVSRRCAAEEVREG